MTISRRGMMGLIPCVPFALYNNKTDDDQVIFKIEDCERYIGKQYKVTIKVNQKSKFLISKKMATHICGKILRPYINEEKTKIILFCDHCNELIHDLDLHNSYKLDFDNVSFEIYDGDNNVWIRSITI